MKLTGTNRSIGLIALAIHAHPEANASAFVFPAERVSVLAASERDSVRLPGVITLVIVANDPDPEKIKPSLLRQNVCFAGLVALRGEKTRSHPELGR